MGLSFPNQIFRLPNARRMIVEQFGVRITDKQGNTILESGMTFSDEPGIYIVGEFGIRLEDDWHLTEDGGKMFTPQSPSLADPFGKA